MIAKPEITTIKITNEHDFIVMGSKSSLIAPRSYQHIGDGIYDKLENDDIIREAWNLLHSKEATNIHEFNKLAVEAILRESLLQKSLDNVTCVMITFSGLEERFIAEANNSHPSRVQTGNTNYKYIEKVPEPETVNLNMDRSASVSGINSFSNENYKKFVTMDEKKYRSITGKEYKEFNPMMRPESGRSLSQANLPKFSYPRHSPRA